MACRVCNGDGTYPIISWRGNYLYDIKCPECCGISDEELERKCAEDRAALAEWQARPRRDSAIVPETAGPGPVHGGSMSTLQQADAEAAAVAVAPRVTLADIEAAIAERHDIMADSAIGAVLGQEHPLSRLSICILVMKNGFTIIGKSAPASAANFNADLGRRFAYEDAVRQMWPLLGFLLRQKLHEDVSVRSGGGNADRNQQQRDPEQGR